MIRNRSVDYVTNMGTYITKLGQNSLFSLLLTYLSQTVVGKESSL